MSISLSVVVVSYNVRPLLERCLAALHGAAELIVVDNGSRDGSVDLVRERFPEAQLVSRPDNPGFSTAVNLGVRQATHDVVLLLNPDTELPVGGLRAMLARFEQRPEAWAMGFRQVDQDGFFQLAVGPPPSLILELGRRVVQRRLDRGDRWMARVVDGLLSVPRQVPWVGGSVMLMRRAAFERVGGWDERFFLYFEDIDYCLRLRRAGGQVIYDPSVTVIHHRGRSAATEQAMAQRAYRESQLLFWEKHRGRGAAALVRLYLQARGLLPRRR